MTYWIDAGVLLQAHKGSLAYTILPQFWNKYLHDHLIAGNIAMPRMAYEEITERGYDDWLVAWCKTRKKDGLCRPEPKGVQERYGLLSAYVQDEFKTKPQQVRAWFDDADGWVIAYAMLTPGDVVVAEEGAKTSRRNAIKIPKLCKQFDVEQITLATLMRDRLKADLSKG